MRTTINAIIVLVCMTTHGFASATTSRLYKSEQDVRTLQAATEMFIQDVGRCPSASEGLAILKTPPPGATRPPGYKSTGYLRDLSLDPWDSEYQYICPGKVNIDSFDIWTYGADGIPGGDGLSSDFGNWPGSFDAAKAAAKMNNFLSLSLIAMVIGFIIGLPIYATGVILKKRRGSTMSASLLGFHLGTLAYLILISLLVILFGPYIG